MVSTPAIPAIAAAATATARTNRAAEHAAGRTITVFSPPIRSPVGPSARCRAIVANAAARTRSGPEFAQSNRLRKYLAFIVEETLAGRADHLMEYSIALEVFERDDSFDPQTNRMKPSGRRSGRGSSIRCRSR